METTTSFDLNQAIHNWRNNLAHSPAFRSENLYELETHLRDSIATLQSNGLSAEESFIIAAKRLGKNTQLEAEFAKQNNRSVWLDRALWILLGAQLWGLAGNFAFSLQTFMRATIPKINEWLMTYGFGRISEDIPGQVLYVVTLPAIILVSAKIYSTLHSWAQQRGWFPLGFVLHRPRLLAGVYGLLCLSPLVIQYGTGFLVQKYSLQQYSGMSLGSGYTLYILVALHAAILAIIVMVVAQRRLRLGRS